MGLSVLYLSSVNGNGDGNDLNNKIKFLNLKIKETGKQEFFEWFSGFCDGESNFSIDLKKLNTLVIFRFRIGIHIDDINILRK